MAGISRHANLQNTADAVDVLPQRRAFAPSEVATEAAMTARISGPAIGDVDEVLPGIRRPRNDLGSVRFFSALPLSTGSTRYGLTATVEVTSTPFCFSTPRFFAAFSTLP